MDKFKAMMDGQERLVITYWVWGVIGTFVVSFVLGFLAGMLGFSLLIVYGLTLVYWIPVALGIWRSSDAYQGNKIWAILAKVAIVLGALGWVYQILLVI